MNNGKMRIRYRIYSTVKGCCSQWRWFLEIVRFIRRVVIGGPWRHFAIKYYQLLKKNESIHVNEIAFFNDLKADNIIHNINKYGYSMGINLSNQYVDEITRFHEENIECHEETKLKIHMDPHKINKTIFDIAHNAKIIEIARKYIGVEPIFFKSAISWIPPSNANNKKIHPLSHQRFHFDVGDFKSLNLFIYLTDTDENCGPHVVIENTHKSKSSFQYIKRHLSDNEAQTKFGDRVKVITGRKGTGFFEDTMSFHKQLIPKKPRLMITFVYVMRRNNPM